MLVIGGEQSLITDQFGVAGASVGNCTVSRKSFADKELARLSNLVKVSLEEKKPTNLMVAWSSTILLTDCCL
jgi:hypothetical protein